MGGHAAGGDAHGAGGVVLRPDGMVVDEHDATGAVGEDVARSAVDLDLLAAEGDEALAAGRAAHFEVIGRRIGDVGVVSEDESRAAVFKDDGADLVTEEALGFAVEFLGGGELGIKGRGIVTAPEAEDEAKHDAGGTERHGPAVGREPAGARWFRDGVAGGLGC